MKKLPILLGGLLALLIAAGAVGATVVYADDATPPAPSGQPGEGGGPRGFGLGARGPAGMSQPPVNMSL